MFFDHMKNKTTKPSDSKSLLYTATATYCLRDKLKRFMEEEHGSIHIQNSAAVGIQLRLSADEFLKSNYLKLLFTFK